MFLATTIGKKNKSVQRVWAETGRRLCFTFILKCEFLPRPEEFPSGEASDDLSVVRVPAALSFVSKQ